MKSNFVFATADSRLHADIMTIRLRRAQIERERVSAVFSSRFAPNSFFFWLQHPRGLRSSVGGGRFFVAGPLREIFGHEEVEAVPALLRKLGLDRQAADRLGESLWLGHAMLGVKARDEDETSIAWHIFTHSRANNIAITNPELTARTTPAMGAAWAPAIAA